MPIQNGLQFSWLVHDTGGLLVWLIWCASVEMLMNIMVAHQIMGTRLVIIYIYSGI